MSISFLIDPPRRFCPGNLPQSLRRGRALESNMKSKHRPMAGPWAFFLMMGLWGSRGYGVPRPLRQESDIAYPPRESLLHALSHPSNFESMGNMTLSPVQLSGIAAGHHPAAPPTPTSTN